jgi:type III secretion protein R
VTGAWLDHLGVTALVALAPFAIIAGTSFAKIALVLSILRSALGAPGIPPASVITALAAVVSMFVMAPVASEMADAVQIAAATIPAAGADPLGIDEARALYEAASPPLIAFLELNTPPAEVEFFAGLSADPAIAHPGLSVLLPAFAVSEIVEAFVIGFLLFVPFLVIDLIVGNVLMALGMHMTAPAAISLPLKLLLFVAVDGWHVLVSGLVVSYGF